MLVNLTPDLTEIERRKEVAKEHNFEYVPQCDPIWIQEIGVYQSACPFNFPLDEFLETNKEGYRRYDNEYGVADTIEQIKSFYKAEIDDTENKYCIEVTPVYQERENRNKGGGWRWHKWGQYIGTLNPQCEYLDDEDFGEDFKFILCYTLYKV